MKILKKKFFFGVVKKNEISDFFLPRRKKNLFPREQKKKIACFAQGRTDSKHGCNALLLRSGNPSGCSDQEDGWSDKECKGDIIKN